MKKHIILILITLAFSGCVNDHQNIKSLTKEQIKYSLVNVDQGEDFYDKKDYANALIHFKKAADFNNPKALFYLGIMYRMGYGAPRDYNKALEYYRLSSSYGHVAATNNLGIMYHYGLGVKKDLNAACLMYKKAVDNGGSSLSFRNLAICYEDGLGDFKKDDGKAIEYYKKAIDLGDEGSIYYLALLYDDKKNYEKSFELFKKASEVKDKEVKRKGLYSVGIFYYLGDVVNKDYKKAVEYFEKSAELGLSDAYNYLGIAYEYGEGVKKNYAKAFFNYKKAAELKNMYGLYRRRQVNEKMDILQPLPLNFRQQLSLA